MAHLQSQSLYLEIQNLNEQLDASQKKIDRYAHLIATLSDELDNLRNNMCHACKKKLVPGNVSVPGTVAAPSSTSPPAFWRRMLQGRQHRSRSVVIDAPGSSPSDLPAITSPIPSQNTNSSLLRPAVVVGLASVPTTNAPVGISPAINPDSGERTTIRKSESLEWSVMYNPDVKQVLDIHVAHVFTYDSPVFCAKISRDGQKLAIGLQNDGRTYIIEAKTRSNICVLVDRYIKGYMSIWSVQFSPDGQLVATAASDDRIRIWDIAQKRVRATWGHLSMIPSIAFSPNGRFVVSASYDGSVRIWNIRDGASRKLPANDFLMIPVTISSDGGYLAACNSHGSLRIWDARTHKLVTNWDGLAPFPWCLEFTPDGKGLIIEGAGHALEYWDVSPLGINKTHKREVGIPGDNFRRMRCFSGHTSIIRSISFFPGNDQWVLTCADDQSARLWDTQSGVCQLTLQGHTGPVNAVDFSPTEKLLLTASADQHVTLWKYEVLR